MKKKADRLRKRDFKKCVFSTVCDCMHIFGYSLMPAIIETTLDGNRLMSFVACDNSKQCAIIYDYQKFQKAFGERDKEYNLISLTYIVAHEMRHYYQHRQIFAKVPKERREVVDDWRNDTELKISCEKREYYGNVREIDAFAFAYRYCANRGRVLVRDVGVPKHYRKVMQDYTKKSFGITPSIFSKKFDKYFD